MKDFVIKNLKEEYHISEPTPLYVENLRLIIENILAQNGISGVNTEIIAGSWYTQFRISILKSISKSLVHDICNDIENFFVSKSLRIAVFRKENGNVQLEIEIPNDEISIIGLKSILESDIFKSCKGLPIGVGITNDNKPFLLDLCDYKNINILVCGSIGQGSNNFINSTILSLLASNTSNDINFVLISKEGHMEVYNDLNKDYFHSLPNLTPQVITNPDLSIYALDELSKQIKERYLLFQHFRVKTIKEFNEKKLDLKLPHIVLILNDYDKLYKHKGKEITFKIARIAKYGYLAGIHVILKTDRPEPQLFPDFIKLNFQCHICFKTLSTIISKLIIGDSGAEKLIGRGDMLVKIDDKITRVMSSYVDYDEIKTICKGV